jgi:hypothetical protein
MYDEAYKKQPGNEELGAQTFMANAKIGNWKVAQQVNTTHFLPSSCASVYHSSTWIPFSLNHYASFLARLYVFSARSPPKCTKTSRTTDTSTGVSWLLSSKCAL